MLPGVRVTPRSGNQTAGATGGFFLYGNPDRAGFSVSGQRPDRAIKAVPARTDDPSDRNKFLK
jgi:hypothetical protein